MIAFSITFSPVWHDKCLCVLAGHSMGEQSFVGTHLDDSIRQECRLLKGRNKQFVRLNDDLIGKSLKKYHKNENFE